MIYQSAKAVHDIVLSLASIVVALVGSAVEAEQFISCDKAVIVGSTIPSAPESTAVLRFVSAVERISGQKVPQSWGVPVPEGSVAICVGNANTLPELGGLLRTVTMPAGDEDSQNQSYVIAARPEGGAMVGGLGGGEEPRAWLGVGYALGELTRCLEVRDGVWGFVLPDAPIVQSPAMPNRTLYLMNSNHMNPGLSLEYFTEAEIEDYVDFLIEARYSRVSLWQWTANMLYPGNFEENRARNQMTHRAMRYLFQYARSRGLQVFHQLAPMHANVKLLPDEPRFTATGYYGPNSICWAQPEARELARNMAQFEMEFYGPVDGYIVWFYDPGGCFCSVCKPNQSKNLFEQLEMIHDLSKTISPGAEFQAVLWPTWCFQDYTDKGIPYESKAEVDAFVKDFLVRARTLFGSRELTIMDTTELLSNLYNGLVDPKEFKRSAFLYSIMGLPSESMYPFASFNLNAIHATMLKARDGGVEDANFFIQYANVNKPSVFAFGDFLYDRESTADLALRRFSAHMASGEAKALFYDVLERLERVQSAATYGEKAVAMEQVESAWATLSAHPQYLGNREWLQGFVLAQRHYLEMARAKEQSEFTSHLETLKEELAKIPMWKDFAIHALGPDLVASHIQIYWRGPLSDPNIVGLPAQ